MSDVGEAFLARFGKPDPAVDPELIFSNPIDAKFWRDMHAEIGSGWYLDRFICLFSQGLEDLQPCLDAWSFLMETGPERKVIGRNAYGALLIAEDPSSKGYACPVSLLDPLTLRYWKHPNLVFVNLLGRWLPDARLPGFLDTTLYEAWHKVTGDYLELKEILAIKVPLALGGSLDANNFQIEEIANYYRTTGPIYEEALKKKK